MLAGGPEMKDYHINVFFSEEDQAYVADIPDLEACSALGATAGKPIPEPKYRPVHYQAG